MNYELQLFDSTDPSIGIKFYGERVFPNSPIHHRYTGTKSFKIKVLVLSGKRFEDGKLNRDRQRETFEFIFTGVLDDYVVENIKTFKHSGKTHTFASFDVELLIKDACEEEQLDYTLTRLWRKVNTEPRDGTPLKTALPTMECQEYYSSLLNPLINTTLIEVQPNETTLCGNIKWNDKEYGLVMMGPLKSKEYTPNEMFSVGADRWGDFISKTKGERREYMESLFKDDETALYFGDCSLLIMGNDDCSYTKVFNTQEERRDEFEYLTKMQPIDIQKDILDRGYIFTN